MMRSFALLALFAAAVSANAAITFYTDEAAFAAASAGALYPTVDASGLAGGTFQTLDFGGVTFSSDYNSSDSLYVIPTGNYGATVDTLCANYFGSSLDAAFSTSVTAFGGYLLGVDFGGSGHSVDATVVESGGASTFQSLTVGSGQYSFFGVVATPGSSIDSIQWLDVTGGSNTIGFTTQAVPEPASMAALGLGGLALLRRRRKSA